VFLIVLNSSMLPVLRFPLPSEQNRKQHALLNCLASVGLSAASGVLSTVTPAECGSWPVRNDCREGVQTGELQ